MRSPWGRYDVKGEFGVAPVDVAVTLPTGESVEGAAAVARVVAQDPRLRLCYIKNLAAYARGLPMEDDAMDALVGSIDDTTEGSGRVVSILEAIVATPWFATRLGVEDSL